MLAWGKTQKKETTLTMSSNSGLERGDLIQVSGFSYRMPGINGPFIVKRVRESYLIVEPATWMDRVEHYAMRVWQSVRWHYYGVIDSLGDLWHQVWKR